MQHRITNRPMQSAKKIHFLLTPRNLSYMGLGLLITAALVLNSIWIQNDGRLGAYPDSLNYILETLTFTTHLETDGLSHFSNIQQLSLSGRPPLYQLLSVPFIMLFGYSMDAGLMVNMLFQALLLISVFNVGRMIGGGRAGLLAAFLSAVYPPLIQLPRQYLPHYAIPACVAFSLWMLLRLMEKSSVKNVWGFVLSLGFGSLIHPFFTSTFFIPAAVFSLYVLFVRVELRNLNTSKDFLHSLWEKLTTPLVLYGYLPSMLLAGGIVSGWYSLFGSRFLQLFQTVTSDELIQYRGYDVFTMGFDDIHSGFFWHLLTMPSAISNIFTLLLGIGLVRLLLRHKIHDWFLLIAFVGAYIYPALLPTKTWMQFAGILPGAAVITAVGVSEIKPRSLSWAFTFLALIAGFFVFSTVNWGVRGSGLVLAKALSAPIDGDGNCLSVDMVFCPRPAENLLWPVDEILKAIADDIQKNGGCEPQCFSLVIVRGRGLFPQTFSYYLRQDVPELWGRVIFRQLGAPAFAITPFNYDLLLDSAYIIYGVPSVISGGPYNSAANDFLVDSTPEFIAAHQPIKTFLLENGDIQIQVVKRIKPLTLAEAEEAIRSLNLDEKYKNGQYRVLAPLYAQAGQFDNALQAYQKALAYEPADARLYFGLAGVYASLGKMGNAARAYQQVIALAPESDLASRAQAWLDDHSE